MVSPEEEYYAGRLVRLDEQWAALKVQHEDGPTPAVWFRRHEPAEAPYPTVGLRGRAFIQAVKEAALCDDALELIPLQTRFVDNLRQICLMREFEILALEERLRCGVQIIGILNMPPDDLN